MRSATIEIKIRGYHLDVFSHVNNARYLEFLEEARWTYIENLDGDWKKIAERGLTFAVVNININYRKAAVLGDVLKISTDVVKLGNSSITMRQEIRRKSDDELVVDAAVTFVIVDAATEKSIPLDDEMRRVWKG